MSRTTSPTRQRWFRTTRAEPGRCGGRLPALAPGGRGVQPKTASGARMFPTADDSETVITCLVDAARTAGVEIRTRTAVTDVESVAAGKLNVRLKSGEILIADRVLLATGSAPATYRWAAQLGHTIEPPVPSLFTFNIEDPRLEGLAGVSVPTARVRLDGAKEVHEGPLLVTHWGLSGPAVLKASAWGARLLHDHAYRLGVTLSGWPHLNQDDVQELLQSTRQSQARRTILAAGPFGLPQRLWRSLATAAGANKDTRWGNASKTLLAALTREVHAGRYENVGKGVFKEEFVTCGGVRLKEVNFKTMESRIQPGLYFAGEVLDIDGITGGFNFQSAWTTGWLAGLAMAGTGA